MRFVFLAVAMLVATAFLGGCAASLEDSVVGAYRAEVDLSGVSPKNQVQSQRMATLFRGLRVEFKKDKTLSFELGGKAVSGRWAVEDGKMKLDLEQNGKMPLFRIEEGGKRLVPLFEEQTQQALAGAQIWLKRE